MEKKTIVICGATGQQGGAFLEAALRKNLWDIVALSRDPESDKSKRLRERGVKIIRADLLDKNSLVAAFNGAYGVFGVTQPWSPGFANLDVQGEVQQGRNIVDACKETGITHLIMSTMISIGFENTKVPYYASKKPIENYLRESKLFYTILKPSIFMDLMGDNFMPINNKVMQGFISSSIKAPYIAIKDIGEMAAIILANPEPYRSREINLIGDFISGNEIALQLSQLRKGETIKYKPLSSKLYMWLFQRMLYNVRSEFEAIDRKSQREKIFDAIQECKKIHPELMTIMQYFKFKNFDRKNF